MTGQAHRTTRRPEKKMATPAGLGPAAILPRRQMLYPAELRGRASGVR